MEYKEKLKEYLTNQVATNGLLQLSGNVFVDHKLPNGQERKANTTVEYYVSTLSEESAKDIFNMLKSLENNQFVSFEESKKMLDAWLDNGSGSPSNRDLVKHDKINKDLLQDLVTFVLLQSLPKQNLPKLNEIYHEALLKISLNITGDFPAQVIAGEALRQAKQ